MRWLVLGVMTVLAGCQQSPSPPTGRAASASETEARPVVSAADQWKAEGDALMTAGDYGAAAGKYRQAIALEPGDVSLRFALGTAYTFLHRRAEAIEQFRLVAGRGEPGSVEHREARRWLASVGVPSEPAGAGDAARPDASAGGAASPLVGGRLVGRTEWPGIDPRVRLIRGEISIVGVEGATETISRSRPFRLGDRYYFYDIPPGQYRIVAHTNGLVENVTLWDQKVVVDDGKPTELVLTPGTAKVSPEKFPPPPPSS
jgi:hypothetical protein